MSDISNGREGSNGSDGINGINGSSDIDQDDEFLKSIQRLYERNSPTGVMATPEDMSEQRSEHEELGGVEDTEGTETIEFEENLEGSAENVFIHGSKAHRNRHVWTYEEDLRIVDALYLHGPKWRKIAHLLKLGSDDAVRNRVLRMKVYTLPQKVQRTVSELQQKRGPLYPNGSGKTYTNVRPNAPPSASHARPWTLEEDELIRKHLKKSPSRSAWQTLHETELPRRTKHAIRNRAGRIGLIPGGVDFSTSDCKLFVPV
jgi:hypothetical protein